ncbi:MAG: UMP kinase, partial [Planctomycetota bacterium]
MVSQGRPKRVLLKVSGNTFGAGGSPFEGRAIDFLATQLADAREECSQIAVVVGGGNIIRGGTFCPTG